MLRQIADYFLMSKETTRGIYRFCIWFLVTTQIPCMVTSLSADTFGEPSPIQIRPNIVNWKMETNWESQYFSQGRDNLDGAPLSTVTVGFEENKFSGGFWFGQSTQVDYREYQSFLEYTESFADIDVTLNATQVQFVGTDETDQELGLSLVWNEVAWGVSLALDSYYSVESEGWFGEIGFSKHLEYFEKLHYDISASLGYNMGYVSDGHLGINNAELVWAFEYHMNSRVSVVGYTAYSWALGSQNTCDGDQCLQNSLRYGFGFRMAFDKRP